MKINRRPLAEADLLEIWLYIAADDPPTADRFLDEIDKTCRLLARNPQMGRRRQELGSGLHSFPIGKYVVFYRPTGIGIEIIRVLHGARDIDAAI